MMRVVLYVRVSTGGQEVDNQLNELRAFCEQKSYSVVGEYCDVISGKEVSRPSYDRMFSDAHKRLFDLVLFWDLSRFSRAGTWHTLNKLRELENLGVGWKSYQEQYFDSTGQFKDVLIAIMSTLAKIERQKISERTKAGLKNAVNVGKRGKDKKPRRRRSDRGVKRGCVKSPVSFINKEGD